MTTNHLLRTAAILLANGAMWGTCAARAQTARAVPQAPGVADPRLTIELFAGEPEIVTPFGITVDPQGRVLVVESHTHMRPADYDGPATDRIRLLVDSDRDGRADRVTTFYEGERWLMNVAAHANGWIYAVSRNELFRIRDADGDGRAEQRQSLARLQTSAAYPHNGFLSVAVDAQGGIYFGLGQNYGAPYRLEGNDGRTVQSDRGDGGIFHCTADGRELTRVAVGFWNPCGIALDAFGRVFAVDNDPGNRPPCRLIEVVPQGDYGYRRHELEPFIAWNGELPGTLPMVASTAEAPTDILRCGAGALLPELAGGLLVSSWSEYRIDLFRLVPQGASFSANSRPLVQGGPEFRPVGLAWAPDGSLFISDWVDRSYPVHGRGRVWRLYRTDRQGRTAHVAGRPSVSTPAERAAAVREQDVRTKERPVLDAESLLASERDARVRAAVLRRIRDPDLKERLLSALRDDDPFIRQAARVGLQSTCDFDELQKLLDHPHNRIRLAALLAIRDRFPERFSAVATRALEDSSEDLKFVALEWIAVHRIEAYRRRLIDDLVSRPMSARLFEATLAAIARIDGVMDEWKPGRNGDWWKSRTDTYAIVSKILSDTSASLVTVRRAIEFLPQRHPAMTTGRLAEWMAKARGDHRLQIAIVRKLPADADGSELLRHIATDRRRDGDVRAEAVLRLAPDRPETVALLVDLAASSGPSAVRQEALRSLRGAALTREQVKRLQEIAGESRELASLVAVLFHQPMAERPSVAKIDQWLKRIDGEGDPAAGARVFFHPRGPGCYKCHRIDGRGRQVGPGFHRTPGIQRYARRTLLQAILTPSREIAQGYIPYKIRTVRGTVHVGMLRTETDREYRLFDSDGNEFAVRRDDVEVMVPSETSIMPDGLIDTMTDQELRDVIEYIRRGVSE